MTALLDVSGVSRRFGDVHALDDVSLTIADNEFFALLGPSGCGKTTLLRSIAGFEFPDAGAITLGGEDLLALPPNKRPVNLMFQSYALFPHLSVEGNVAYGLHRERLPKTEIRQRVGEVLETVGLSALASRRPSQLSGGQRQRVALARAIVKRPKLLLLDEPLSALDRQVRGSMQLELKRLQHEVGITFVVVTHDQEEAMSMADRVAVMAEGKVQQTAPPVELYREPTNLFVASFVGSSNRFTGRADGGAFVAAGLGRLPHGGGPLPEGDATLVVRPEDARFVDLELDFAGAGALRGVVREVSFQGAATTVAVDVPGLDAPFLVTVPGISDVRRGAEVGLGWDRAVVVGDRPA